MYLFDFQYSLTINTGLSYKIKLYDSFLRYIHVIITDITCVTLTH